MSTKGKGLKRSIKDADQDPDEVDLFARLTTKDKDDAEDGTQSDTTDSEESEYSGLEEEESSDGEPFEELSDSEGGLSDDDSEAEETSDEDDDEDDDDDDEDEDEDDDEDAGKLKSNDITNRINDRETQKGDATSNKALTESSTVTKSGKSRSKKEKSTKSLLGDTKHKSSRNEKPTTSKGIIGTVPDEYAYDSSDEEDLRNTVGNIPMEWYREYEHIGYNLDGNKIIKPPTGDEIDNFLNKMDNPNYWRTILDKTTGQNVVLSEQDCEMIKRFRKGKYVDSKVDPYEPWVDFFSYEKMLHPVTNQPAHKRSFIPSKWEKLKVGRMVHAIKMGWMKPVPKKSEEEETPDYYMLWKADEQPNITRVYRSHIPAPKLPLPGHEESYNPPPEYLLTEEEELAWKEQDPEDRRMKFLPRMFSTLRQVPGYDRFMNERFERCLDLYLCPRQRKTRMRVDPADLLPNLPKPKDLQPFPTTQSIVYSGHESIIRCISVAPCGQWIASGSDDETVRFWEISTGRCMKTIHVGGAVKSIAWNPNSSLCLVAAVVGEDVYVLNPGLGDKLVLSNTDNLIKSYIETDTAANTHVQWFSYTEDEFDKGFRLKITHTKAASHVSWHARGDYMSVVMPTGDSKSVVIHQLSKRRSQNPFNKSKGMVQCVLFHPTRPFLFVATQRYVRVYNLLKQELSKKLMTNVRWVSSMAVHPGGDNVIIGSYDSKLSWFDLDLSTKPYQTLRHHKKAIRQVCYHKKYPLFASCSDDGSIIICHGRVYNDLMQNPLIVPVKVLRGHAIQNSLGVLGCEFHPTQPWVFSSGSDHTIRLFT